MERDRKATEDRLTQLEVSIEAERSEKEQRLKKHMEEMETLRTAINTSTENHKAQIEQVKHLYKATSDECQLQQRLLLDAIRQDMEMKKAYLQRCNEDTQVSLRNIDEFDKEFGEGKC